MHVAEVLAIALEEGMRTLKQDGMEKCLPASPTSRKCARCASNKKNNGER